MDGKIRRAVSSDVSKASKVVKLGLFVDFRLGEPTGTLNMNWTTQQRSRLLFVNSKII
jgi:hypothetical protein